MHAAHLQSARHATAILAAWQGGDVAALRREMEHLDRLTSQTVDPSELERMELLSSILRELSDMERPQADRSTQVYYSLLGHLANVRPLESACAPAAKPRCRGRCRGRKRPFA